MVCRRRVNYFDYLTFSRMIWNPYGVYKNISTTGTVYLPVLIFLNALDLSCVLNFGHFLWLFLFCELIWIYHVYNAVSATVVVS